MPETASTYPIVHDILLEFGSDLLEAAGVPRAQAERVCVSLVGSNLRGHDSHGVVRIVEYVDQLRQGILIADSELKILHETPAMVHADAAFGFGMVQCDRLISLLVPRAQKVGVACGTLRNSGHVGRLGEWVEVIAESGCVGMVTVNDNGVLQCVAPPGGIDPKVSTNPVAFGIPNQDGNYVVDISTSSVANGKINVAHISGQTCPPGWLQDSEGNPTNDPGVRFQNPPGSLLPMGGPQGYKGFGLSLALDMMCGGLAGGQSPPAPESAPLTNNLVMMIWDPAHFAGCDHMAEQSAELIAHVRSAQLKPGVDEIQIPGDRSAATFASRSSTSIPLSFGTWNKLLELAAELGVVCQDGPQSDPSNSAP